MPFTPIKKGKNKGKFRSPSGRIFTKSQVKRYYARGGKFEQQYSNSRSQIRIINKTKES